MARTDKGRVQVVQAPGLAPSTGPQLRPVSRPLNSAPSQATFEERMSGTASHPVLPSAQVSASSMPQLMGFPE